MACFSHWLLLCSMCVLFTTSLCSYEMTVEKGSPAEVTCFTSKKHNISWQVRGSRDFITLTSCSYNSNNCVDYMPHLYHGKSEKTTSGFEAILSVSGIRTNETDFRCFTKETVSTIKFEVYAHPNNPICDPVEVDDTKRNLVFKCRASNVYPFIEAQLSIKRDDLRQRFKPEVFIGHCSNEKSVALTSDTYVAECVWHVPAEKLDPYKYMYFVVVYPSVSISSGVTAPHATSQNYTLTLSIPKAVIDDTQCPGGPGVRDDKLTNGSTSSCRCVLESTGFPPAQARWYTLDGNESVGVDDIADGSSTLVTHNLDQIYECVVWSPLRNALKRGGPITFITDPMFPVQHDNEHLEDSRARGSTWVPERRRLQNSHKVQIDNGHLEDSRARDSKWVTERRRLPNSHKAPGSDHEPISLRIEVVVGMVAAAAGLTATIAVVFWRWRSHKRQTADSACQSKTANSSCLDSANVIYKNESSGDYSSILIK